ncbi:MAG: CotH kinase family protein [Clostridia bacterium]|nr:CotH kinase family protein [Clostridia bacterium]
MKKIFLFIALFCVFAASARGDGALPVLRLDAAQLDYVSEKPGTLTAEGFTTPVAVKYRGAYSITFTGKRNYTLHLKTPEGGQRKVSLLNLRADDDYVLLGGLSDPSRLRCPAGLTLWRSLGYPAPRAAACELYFGSYYKGVYFLTERPDRKSADVPKDGALYRILAERADGVDLFSAEDPGQPGQDAWYNVGKVYPQGPEGWQPLSALLRQGEGLLDLDAFADYYLFVNLIGASDNMVKNLFLCWDGSRFYPMPWDLDAAFGRLYNAEPSDPEIWYSGPIFDGLLNEEDFQALLRRRWAALRPSLSPDAVMAVFEDLYARIDGAGAWERERQRFPQYTDSATGAVHPLDPQGETALIRDFITRRYALLNAEYGGI